MIVFRVRWQQNYLLLKHFIAATARPSYLFPSNFPTSEPQLEWRCKPQSAYKLHHPLSPV